jgi:hypothetical protein
MLGFQDPCEMCSSIHSGCLYRQTSKCRVEIEEDEEPEGEDPFDRENDR